MTTNIDTEALALIRDALRETIAAVRNISIASGQHMGANNWARLERADARLNEVDKLFACVDAATVPTVKVLREWAAADAKVRLTFAGGTGVIALAVLPANGEVERATIYDATDRGICVRLPNGHSCWFTLEERKPSTYNPWLTSIKRVDQESDATKEPTT